MYLFFEKNLPLIFKKIKFEDASLLLYHKIDKNIQILRIYHKILLQYSILKFNLHKIPVKYSSHSQK